jgi:hypothetical protein
MSPRATTTSPTILAVLLVTLIGHLQFHPFTTPTQGTSDAGIFVLAASSLLALYLVTIPGLLRRRQSGSESSTFTHVVREANDLIFLSGAMVWLWCGSFRLACGVTDVVAEFFLHTSYSHRSRGQARPRRPLFAG